MIHLVTSNLFRRIRRWGDSLSHLQSTSAVFTPVSRCLQPDARWPKWQINVTGVWQLILDSSPQLFHNLRPLKLELNVSWWVWQISHLLCCQSSMLQFIFHCCPEIYQCHSSWVFMWLQSSRFSLTSLVLWTFFYYVFADVSYTEFVAFTFCWQIIAVNLV